MWQGSAWPGDTAKLPVIQAASDLVCWQLSRGMPGTLPPTCSTSALTAEPSAEMDWLRDRACACGMVARTEK